MEVRFENKYKAFFYILLIVAGIIIWLSISTCNSNKNRSNYFFDKFLADSTQYALTIKENKLGEKTTTVNATELTKDEFEQYVEAHPEFKKELANKYKTIKTIIKTVTVFKVDSINIPVHDTLPCGDFEKVFPVDNKFYSFKLDFKNKKGFEPKINVLDLTIPDSSTTVIGIKKSGFLNLKHSLVAETRHSNTYMSVTEMQPITTADVKKHTARNVGIGAGLGVIGTIIIRSLVFSGR